MHLVTNLGNKILRLDEHQQNIFFTADRQSVIFEENQIILPGSDWKKDDITIKKIKDLLKNDPKNIQVRKESLEELQFIYEATNQQENLDLLKMIISD